MHTLLHNQENQVYIPGPAGRLEARVYGLGDLRSHPNDPSLVGIMCHPHPQHQGTMDNKIVSTVTRTWQKMGLATVRFNYRGVGQSEGKYGEGIGEMADLQAVIEWVAQNHPGASLWLGGFSFGSIVSLKLVTEWPFKSEFAPLIQLVGLISIAIPVSYFENKPLNSLPPCPWLVLHGDQDELFSVDALKTWYASVTAVEPQDLPSKVPQPGKAASASPFVKELIIVPQSSHFFHGKLVELKTHIGAFMRSVMTPVKGVNSRS